jgi:tetratricopeptide (TPR) repeat protein
LRGEALTEQGKEEEGIVQIQKGLEALQATGAELRRACYLATLAVAYANVGKAEEGLTLLAKALDAIHENMEYVYEAELYRIKGQLVLQSHSLQSAVSDPQGEAEACFLKAIEIARKQQAKSLELRAAVSLARLWQQQGKQHEARNTLSEIYGWFTEGFDTKDLQEAEALLRTLGGKVERKQQQTGMVDGALPTPASNLTPVRSERTLSPEHRILNAFRNEGEYWTLAFQGALCRVKDTRGMQYLAQLLQHPRHEFHALALATGSADLGVAPSLGAATLREVDDRADSVSAVGGFTDAGEVLDPQAKAAYKQRLQELQAELEEAQAFNDPGRAEKLREEIDFLTQELVQAVGLGGRTRKAASPVERARVNVTRAIRTAITKITDSHPALGQYLTQTIKTGTFCVYTPDSHLSVDWQF